MRFHASTSRAAALGLLALAAASSALAAESRALDSAARVLTVGNWTWTTTDGGQRVRVPDIRVLSWELRDGSALVLEGSVPGTEDDRLDATPTLSRNPVTGDILLAWSRLDASGRRDLVVGSFDGTGFDASSIRVLAESDVNQLDPVVVHDADGRAAIAWREMTTEQEILLVTLDADGSLLGTRSLSEGMSFRNGAPAMGVDASGRLHVAWFGLDQATATPRLFVMAVLDQGGGTIHLPEPVLELGLRVQTPVPLSVNELVSGTSPRLTLTNLGGTPLGWWTSVENDRLVLHHAAQPANGDWLGASLGSIDLGPASNAGAADVQAALALLEARLRRVSAVGREGASPLPLRPVLGAPRRW